MINNCCPHSHNCCCNICTIPGPQGQIGPTGPTGATGFAGETGIQGPQGAPGEPGMQGEQGPQGPAGPEGLAATISIEDSVRVPYDNSPYVKNVGTPHAAVLRFGIPAGMPGTPGEQGIKGETGGQGPAGEAGKSAYRIALDNGFVGTEAKWLDSLKGERGATGTQGIQGERGATGTQGIQGERGATGPIAAVIPFSASKYGTSLSAGENGEPLMIAFSGFCPAYAATTYLEEGEWSSGYIRIREDTPYPTAFVMTFNGTLKKMYALFSTYYSAIEEGVTVRPFACLAISDTDELVYRILKETIVYADPYVGGTTYPNHTIRKGSRTDLNVAIAEGALVAIVTGIVGTGITGEQSVTLSGSGGIYLE